MTTHVFVYGTLTDPERVAAVVEEFEFVGAATLVGLHRVEGTYPTLAPGGQTEGRLLVTPDVDALDVYEGVDRGLYARVSVPLRGAPVASDGRAAGDEEGNKDICLDDEKSAKEYKKSSEGNKNVVESALTVELYVGDPDALSVSESVPWPDEVWSSEDSFAAQVRSHLRGAGVYVRVEA